MDMYTSSGISASDSESLQGLPNSLDCDVEKALLWEF